MKNISKKDIVFFIATNDLILKATQPKLCVPIINRMCKKITAGIYFSPVKADGSLLCDGHHRYIASLLSGTPVHTVPALASPSTKEIAWHDVAFEDEEWDTEAKINMLNEQDALCNDMALEKLLRLLW